METKKVAAVLRSKRSPLRATVKFDDGESVMLPLEVVMTAGILRGKELGEAALQQLRTDADLWGCREAALRLIEFRARSGKELRGRLLRRGFQPGIVDQTVVNLFQSGLLDDKAFATAFANDRLRSRPVGRSRLVYELRSKGIDEEIARQAADEAYASTDDEIDLARRAARRFRRRSGEDETRAKRRLFGMLSRRGFSSETIRTIAAELLG